MRKSQYFPFQCWVLDKGTTGTIFITSYVWRGPWLGIERGTSRTRCQHSTTRLMRRRSTVYFIACFKESLAVESGHPVWEVPGSIPSQGPCHTKDVIKWLQVKFPGFAPNIKKGNTGSFWRIKIGQKKGMNKILAGNPLKSDVIGHCGRYGTNKWPRKANQ